MRKAKKTQTAFRMPIDLKKRLEDAARANGEYLNAEVCRRLEESLAAPSTRDQTHVPGLLAVAAAMNAAGQQAGFMSTMSGEGAQRWWNDPYAFHQAIAAANRVFDAMRPPGPIVQPPGFSGHAGNVDMGAVANMLGMGMANGILTEISSDEPTSTTAITRAPKLRDDLGPDLVARIKSYDLKRKTP